MSQKENVKELIQSTTVPNDPVQRQRMLHRREPVHVVDMPALKVWVKPRIARERNLELRMLLAKFKREDRITEAKLRKKWDLTPEEAQSFIAICGVVGVLKVERKGNLHAMLR